MSQEWTMNIRRKPSMVNSKGEWSLDKLLGLFMEEFMLLQRDEEKKLRMSGCRHLYDGQYVGVFEI